MKKQREREREREREGGGRGALGGVWLDVNLINMKQ